MCRGLTEIHPRRCPSSGGEIRNARDRANYTLNKGAGITSAVDEKLTSAPESLLPISLDKAAASVREDLHTAYHQSTGTNLGYSNYNPETYEGEVKLSWGEIEENVRNIGAALEDRANAIAGFTAEEAAERHLARSERVKNEIDPLYEKLRSRASERVKHQITMANRENPDADNSVLLAEMDALQVERANIQAEADTLGAAIAKECGLGDINPNEVNGAMRKIEQGTDPLTIADMRTLGAARMEALREVREMGGVKVETNDNSNKRVTAVMEEVAEYYPSDWIRKSNELGNLKVKDTKGRAHYSSRASQKIRKQMTDMRTGTLTEPPDDTNEWVRGVWTGSGWSNPIENPNAVENYAGNELPTDPNTRALWYRPAYKYRKAMRYYSGESVEGTPPRGWEEEFETLSDGTRIRVFKQPRWRMTHGEFLSELTVDRDKPASQWQETKGFGTALHEFAHRCEHANPTIFQLEEEFLRRRTTKSDGEREKLQPIYGDRRELSRFDSFADKYMGKEYNDSYREVMSTGMEAVFAGAFGSISGLNNKTSDADMRAFILGVLATA